MKLVIVLGTLVLIISIIILIYVEKAKKNNNDHIYNDSFLLAGEIISCIGIILSTLILAYNIYNYNNLESSTESGESGIFEYESGKTEPPVSTLRPEQKKALTTGLSPYFKENPLKLTKGF